MTKYLSISIIKEIYMQLFINLTEKFNGNRANALLGITALVNAFVAGALIAYDDSSQSLFHGAIAAGFYTWSLTNK